MQQVPTTTASKPRLRLPPSLIVLPAGLWLSMFMLVPMVIIAVFSLGARDQLGHMVPGFQFDNYARFFQGPYLICLWRSLVLAGATTVLCLLFAFPCAMWLAFMVPKKEQNFWMTLITVPLWTSFLLRIYAWIVILRPTGLLTAFLTTLGISNPPVVLYTPWAVLLGMLYNYVPYMVLPLYSSLEKLDVRLVEAAQDLGANNWITFAKIVVPLSTRGIIAGVIMVFVPSLGDYVTPDLMGGAKNMYIGSLIQNQFLLVRDWAFGSAVSTILLCIVGVGVYIYLKYGETETV